MLQALGTQKEVDVSASSLRGRRDPQLIFCHPGQTANGGILLKTKHPGQWQYSAHQHGDSRALTRPLDCALEGQEPAGGAGITLLRC